MSKSELFDTAPNEKKTKVNLPSKQVEKSRFYLGELKILICLGAKSL